MKTEKDKIILNLELRNANGKKAKGVLFISDGLVSAVFSDNKITKDLYKVEKEQGKPVSLVKGNKPVFIKRYAGKSKEEIAKILKKEIEHTGAKFLPS